jgi:glycosyltransferase involved in cell wall biosynthesis
MPELVSILVPAYNAESWLAETLRSALAQTWPRIEVIVVDDGSKDRTLEVARTFESHKVKVVTQPNMGAPGTRNKAFDHAQGTYIQWLDADDLLDPRKIATQMAVAAEIGNRRVPLACPFGQFYYRPEKAIFRATSLWRDLTPTEYFLTRFNDNTFFQTDTWLVSRELSEAAGQWTDHDSPDDDGEYFCRVVMKSDGVKFVGDARTYYRIGNYGALNKARSARAQTALFGSKVKCIRYLMSLEDSPRSRAAAVRLLQDNLSYFYPDREDLVQEARRMASELGGKLTMPTVKWKYRPLEWLCGHDVAMAATRILPRLRANAARQWDKSLYRLLPREPAMRAHADGLTAIGPQE